MKNSSKEIAIVLEIKNNSKVSPPRKRERIALEAYNQIKSKDYERKYRENDYTTFCYGIAFTGKSLAVSNGEKTVASNKNKF